jgi:hypothetical protein
LTIQILLPSQAASLRLQTNVEREDKGKETDRMTTWCGDGILLVSK